MRPDLTRRQALETSFLFALGAQYGTGAVAADGHDHDENGPTLNRFATTVYGAEITGLHVTDNGRLFFNVQHPNADGDGDTVEPGVVGSVAGVNVYGLPKDFSSVQIPDATDDALTEFDKSVQVAKGEYRGLAEGGEETDDGEPLGIPLDVDGEPLTDGKDPDFNGFVPHPTAENEGFLFTNWESTPGKMSRLHVRETAPPGGWEVLGTQNVDFSDVQGTWNNCFGSVSPWDTPLTSEEYEPDASQWFHPDATYFGGDVSMEAYLGEVGNPYRYGFIVEIGDPAGDPTPVKHFSMGRFSHENSVVMPDEKTVYMSDDGTGTVFFKYVADDAGDLSSGTLYAAKAKQGSGTDPAEVGFEIEWVELAHASDDQVEAWISEYDDQGHTKNPDVITDADVQDWAKGEADDDRVAFLESRKAAAAKGATNEFRKLEGVNIAPNAHPGDYLYMAMSEVNETMADDEGDIQLEGNAFGAVYRLLLENDYDVSQMEPVLVGGPETNVCGGCPYDAAPNSKSTVCEDCSYNPNKEDNENESLVSKGMSKLTSASSTVDEENAIANPDNLVVLPDGRVIIGEDSDHHVNNMLWVYGPEAGDRGRGRK